MQLPNWLAGLTNARTFANNPENNFQPTFGDALQGIGNSMATHWQRNFGNPQTGNAQHGAARAVPLETGIVAGPGGGVGFPGVEAILAGLRGDGPAPYAPPAPLPAPGTIQVGTPGFGGGSGMMTQLPVGRWGIDNPLRGLGL